MRNLGSLGPGIVRDVYPVGVVLLVVTATFLLEKTAMLQKDGIDKTLDNHRPLESGSRVSVPMWIVLYKQAKPFITNMIERLL